MNMSDYFQMGNSDCNHFSVSVFKVKSNFFLFLAELTLHIYFALSPYFSILFIHLQLLCVFTLFSDGFYCCGGVQRF